MNSTFQLVLGTFNKKKRAELAQLIDRPNVKLLALTDYPEITEVDETGTTFAENAELKATGYARALNQWVLAEDSGLSVAALHGQPGIYSARFSGDEATDDSNNRLLLEKMRDFPVGKRGAWYTCHIVLTDPDARVRARSEATCHGRIVHEPRGKSGFGYDPLFEIPEYKLTFGELGESVKAVLSHRARAWRRLLPQLLAVIQAQTEIETTAQQ